MKTLKFGDVSSIIDLGEKKGGDCVKLFRKNNTDPVFSLIHIVLHCIPVMWYGFHTRKKKDPTIKYFMDGDSKGEDYQGGRDFDSLKSFVEETLEVKCDVKSPTECSEKEKAYIEKMKAKSKDDRVKQIARLEGMAGESMKADLKAWLRQRLHILRSLEA